jgi:hypothetical protein
MIPLANKSLVFKVSPCGRCLPGCVDLAFFLTDFFLRHPSRSDVDPGKGMKESKNIQQPQDNSDNHHAIQN